jgi:D-sedoheptulose 7-phosphate isomerase
MPATHCKNAAAYLAQMNDLLAQVDRQAIDAVASRLYQAHQLDQLVMVFGNGGSSFTASHFVTDLVKTASVEGHRRLRALSLADNMGLVTAVGNDILYDAIFAYQLESFARPGDVAIAISASGNSPNVVMACRWAKDHGVEVIALTGFKGGEVASIADLHVNIPSSNYGLIEDLHLSIGHIVSQSLHLRLRDGSTSP